MTQNCHSYIAKKCGIEREDVCIITKGEQTLIDLSSTCVKNSLILQCTRHFEGNCQEVLEKIGVPLSIEEIMIDSFWKKQIGRS